MYFFYYLEFLFLFIFIFFSLRRMIKELSVNHMLKRLIASNQNYRFNGSQNTSIYKIVNEQSHLNIKTSRLGYLNLF